MYTSPDFSHAYDVMCATFLKTLFLWRKHSLLVNDSRLEEKRDHLQEGETVHYIFRLWGINPIELERWSQTTLQDDGIFKGPSRRKKDVSNPNGSPNWLRNSIKMIQTSKSL
jgi:hypothetical protein